jgi:hypothetical protein
LTPPDKLDENGDGSADERDITEEQKRSGGRNKRSLRGAHMVEQFCQKMSRKVTSDAHYITDIYSITYFSSLFVAI